MITYVSAISACEEFSGQWQLALPLLAELRVQVIQPNVRTSNSAVSARQKSTGRWQLALKLLAELQV